MPEQNILGIRYGFRGFYDKQNRPITLTRSVVEVRNGGPPWELEVPYAVQ